MGFRFQKRIKLLPGVTINLSKSGVSTSLGPHGARVTLGHGKTRTTLGVPGTGISYTEIHKNPESAPSEEGVPIVAAMLMIGFAFIVLVLIIAN